MNLPTREECFRLMTTHGLCGEFENVRQHSLAVNRAAMWLAIKLKATGVDVDIELVDRASLLHDIAKVYDIKASPAKGTHDKRGYEILNDKYPEVAKLVLNHVIFRVDDCRTWEEKTILYSDLRIMHYKVIELKDRLTYVQKKYYLDPKVHILLKQYAQKVFSIEKELFERIGKSPEDLLS